MSLFTFCSLRGSPGVTTAALLVAGALDRGVVAEADPGGGVLAVRYGLGQEPGMSTLAARRDGGAAGWMSCAQMAGGVPVLVGPEAPESARALWTRVDGRLVAALRATDREIVVDAGRVSPGWPPVGLLRGSTWLVVLAHPRSDHLVAAARALPVLRQHAERVGFVLVGSGDYPASAVEQDLGVEVLGRLPNDPRSAQAYCGEGFVRSSRSPLVRAARSLAEELLWSEPQEDHDIGGCS